MPTTPGLLLMHGVGDDGACWGPFVARLRAEPGMADLVVATPDAPAHGGRRVAPGQGVGWVDLLAAAIAEAEALVERTGGPIVSAGHSMGSMMALGLSATRPDLVVATFLEDPPFMYALPPLSAPSPAPAADVADDTDPTDPTDPADPTDPTDSATDPADPATPTEAGLTDLGELYEWFTALQSIPFDQVLASARAEHPTWDPAEYEPWARAKQSVDVAAFAAPVAWVHADTERIIRDAPAPVVVAAGLPELGGLLAPVAEVGLAALPGWTIHRLDAGHDVRRDAPDATAALLAALIRAVPR